LKGISVSNSYLNFAQTVAFNLTDFYLFYSIALITDCFIPNREEDL